MITHQECKKQLRESQEADHDLRTMSREANHFITKRDGMWEPQIISKFSGKPRYTLDAVTPIVDDIVAEITQADFSIRVNPSGGDASVKMAQVYEGIIRHIENISQAKFVYNASARIMVTAGVDGWRVTHEYRDDDSFQQDLMIKKIHNYEDSVWFDVNAKEQTMRDAEFCWVLTSLTREAYDEKWPEGSGISVGSEIRQQVYSYKKPHEVVVGEYLWRKKTTRTLGLLSNGRVVDMDDEDFKKVKDDLEKQGITVVRTRKRPYHIVHSRMFDGMDWLENSKETVFNLLPIIPTFGNFRNSENKNIWAGVVEKLMDPQRILNYSESRRIEEGALAPRGKYWVTKDQAKSPEVRRTLRTLNTNMDPVQFYDWAEGQGIPTFQGSPASNPGLSEISQSAERFIQRVSGTWDEAQGTAPSQRSGVAVGLLQMKSDNPKRKWFTAMEIAIQHTCEILVKAIPKVYDTPQQMRLVNQDGTLDEVFVNQTVVDEETGEPVTVNDLSQGKYDVTATAGPAFHSRQQETVTTINEMAQIDPTIMQIGADVLLNNISSPGMDQIAERKRMMMLAQGAIPQTQMTQAEQQMMQQAQGQEKTSALDQANLMIAQATAADIQGKNEERGMKLQLEQQKLRIKEMELQVKAQVEASKLELAQQKSMNDTMESVLEQVKIQAEALKTIREAIGAETIVSPIALDAYQTQADNVNEAAKTQ